MEQNKLSQGPGRLLRVPEVGERLGVSRRSVFALISGGALRSVMVGARSRRVPESEVTAYVARLLANGKS